MSSIKFIFRNLLLIMFVLGCSNDSTTETPRNELDPRIVFEASDISYGPDARQKMDIYLPANRNSNTKAMILVHGGGWTSGDKEDMNALKLLFQQNAPNLAIININYRLADENNPPYPMQIDDISSAVAFLKENKTRYSISEDIGFTGISAGGHLALLWSYAFDTDSKTNMVCSIVGPTNLADPAYVNNTSPELQELLDLYLKDTSIEFLEEVSPLHQATVAAPPTILFYGGKDPLIPISQGMDLKDQLQLLDVTHEYILYPNAGHGWVGLELLDTWTKLQAFTEVHL